MQMSAADKPVFYMAPMLGITDASFRTAFMKSFGGFDFGISPFVRTLQGQRYKKSGVLDLEPQNNTALKVFPQILTNQVDDFIHLAQVLFELGYPVINLNMGCPVPTSAGRGRGAGLLPEIDYVDKMLDQVLAVIPNRLSIKTRVGMESPAELAKMAVVFNRYPLREIIIHPRTGIQKYRGSVDHEAFSQACGELKHEVVYSGDIFHAEDLTSLKLKYPFIRKWMVGRGILQDPFLMQKIRGCEPGSSEAIISFLLSLADLYAKRNLSQHIILSRLKTLVLHLGIGMVFPKHTVKKLRKTKTIESLISELSLALV